MPIQTISDLIKNDVLSVEPATSIHQAVEVMRAKRVSCLVVEHDGAPAGIVTERDVVRSMAFDAARDLDRPVSAIMSRPVITAGEDMDVIEAMNFLLKRNIRHLVAVDAQGRLRGVVSQTDLIEWMGSERALNDIPVGRMCCGRPLLTAMEDTSLGAAMRLMAQGNASCLVVMNAGQAVGIFTERDVVSVLGGRADLETAPLARHMSSPVHTVAEDACCSEAIAAMRRNQCRRLVVVGAKGRAKGLVTQTDLVREMRWNYVETMRHMLANLQESELRYQKIFENALHGIFQSTPEGSYIRVNPALARIYGYESPQEMLTALDRETGRVYLDPLDREQFLMLLKERGSLSGYEVRRRRKDGSEIWVSIHAVLVKDGDGLPLHVEGMVEDVTERRLAEQALEESRQAAESANRAKSEFLSMINHEIRSPLSVILGMNELLAETDLDETQREYLALAKSASENLLTVISDILDITRAETGTIELRTVAFNLPKLVERICKIVAPGAQAKQLDLSCWIDPDVPASVKGDPDRLRQILLNFMFNAVKFTSHGHVILRVERPSQDGNLVRFSVEDTGIGIPLDKQRAIFENFTQADSSPTRSHGGVGLGLSIASKLVRLMGGEVGLQSVPGDGATFSCAVPFEPCAEADGQAAGEGPPQVELHGVKAMVVDDSAVNRMMLRRLLEPMGLSVAEAADGASALDRMAEAEASPAPCDILLIECHLPDMSGFDLAERLQGLYGQRGRGAPRLILIASGDRQGDMVRALASRFDGYLVKPVARDELHARVAEAARRLVRPAPAPAKTRPRPQRILLVDDDPSIKTLLKLYLKNLPCRLEVADNGFNGLEKFISDRYDLVLMDIMMPYMDGLETIQTMRRWEREQGDAETPIVMLTACLSQGQELYYEAGCSGYLTKPVTKATFLRTVARFVDIGIDPDPMRPARPPQPALAAPDAGDGGRRCGA